MGGAALPDYPLHLAAASLFSKWGFHDGDYPDPFGDWCRDRGVPSGSVISLWGDVLEALVRERLLPEISAEVELCRIPTTHNPVRALTVDGRNVKALWFEPRVELPVPDVTVAVAWSNVLAVAERLRGES